VTCATENTSQCLDYYLDYYTICYYNEYKDDVIDTAPFTPLDIAIAF